MSYILHYIANIRILFLNLFCFFVEMSLLCIRAWPAVIDVEIEVPEDSSLMHEVFDPDFDILVTLTSVIYLAGSDECTRARIGRWR